MPKLKLLKGVVEELIPLPLVEHDDMGAERDVHDFPWPRLLYNDCWR